MLTYLYYNYQCDWVNSMTLLYIFYLFQGFFFFFSFFFSLVVVFFFFSCYVFGWVFLTIILSPLKLISIPQFSIFLVIILCWRFIYAYLSYHSLLSNNISLLYFMTVYCHSSLLFFVLFVSYIYKPYRTFINPSLLFLFFI